MSLGITISAIRAFNDNYIWCIHDTQSAVVVDPGDAEPVLVFLQENSLTLNGILITHHHYDHTGGILPLKERYPTIPVIGPANKKIKGLTQHVSECDEVSILGNKMTFSVLQTPGHTLDHIAFYDKHALFCGDTLFSVGCGRMFEGTPEVFLESLSKLASLDVDTKVYCTHEYTLANIQFARYLLPEHKALMDYQQWAQQQRAQDHITLPSTIAQQRDINPFLQCHDPAFQQDMADKLQQNLVTAVDTFAAIRSAKDNF